MRRTARSDTPNAFDTGIAGFVPAALVVAAMCVFAGCSSKSDPTQGGQAEIPEAMTDAERELFFGPIEGEGMPVPARARQLIAELEDGVTKNEFRSVLRSLRKLGPEAIPILGGKLDSIIENPDASRQSAYIADNLCDVFGQMEEPAAEPYLVRALGHPTEFVRIKAIQGLAKLGTEACVPAVIPLLDAENVTLREYAKRILLRVGSAPAREALLAQVREFPSIQMTDTMEALAAMGEEGVRPLAEELLQSDGPLIRLAAAKALYDLGDSRGLEVLVQSLDHERPDVGFRAAEILALRSEPEAVAALEKLYERTDDPNYHRIIAIGLRETGKGSWDFLMKMREDSTAQTRIEINRALGAIDPSRTRELLRADIESDDPDDRRDAIRSLRHVPGEESIRMLMDTFDKVGPVEAKYVLTSLQKNLDPVAVPLFIDAILDDDRLAGSDRSVAEVARDAAPVFGSVFLASAVPAYESAKSTDARRRIVRSVAKTLHREVLPTLGRLFEAETDPSLRLEIREAAKEARRNSAFFSELQDDRS